MYSKAKSIRAVTKSLSSLKRWLTAIERVLKSCRTITGTKLDTIRKMIGRWAPPKENHTEKYIQFVSDYAGIPADDPININNREQMIRIVAGMSRFENGREADMSDVIAGWNLL